MRLNILKTLVLVILLAAWQLSASLSIIPHHKLPSLWETILSIKTLVVNGLPPGYRLIHHLLESLYRVFAGFIAALAIAIPLGIFMGWSRLLREFLSPLVEIIRPIPPLAWIPIAIFWFGIGLKSAAFIIFLGSFFPILLSTVSGVLSVDTILIDAYDMVDLQISKQFAKKFTASLDIQNIFDNEYIDRKGYLSPGRFITGEIKFKF